jgi:DNA invertase Pin-like site-specific DNA recombinase
MTKANKNNQQRVRYAIYVRYSSEMQNEKSLEDQEAVCREAIAARGGVVVQVYRDGAETGWNLDRPGFNDMRKAAERGKFDAVMMWKFDRLARDHDHSVMIKFLLRREYGLKLYCVEGFSEDDDDGPYGGLLEQIFGIFSAFYSKNLSTETKRAKRQRAIRGEFNGSRPPTGYILVTVKLATADRPAGLYIDPAVAAVVLHAFELYSTGTYSDSAIAIWMNEQPAIQELRQGKQPINKDMVRDMLQNRTYTGMVSYSETLYNGTLGEGKKGTRGRKMWYEGLHQPIIPNDLFEQCQEVRAKFGAGRHSPRPKKRTYLLNDRVYCAACIAEKPAGLVDDLYGKMRPYWHKGNDKAYYRCRSVERGYEACGQPLAEVEDIDAQVVGILSTLTIPDGFRERLERAVTSRVDNEMALARMEEIRGIIERVDFRWDQGFIDPDEYVQKRGELEREMESLRPIDYDELTEAADLIENFGSYWESCEDMDKPQEARQQLIRKIVERVFVYDGEVVALVLYGDFGVVLGEDNKQVSEIASSLEKKWATEGFETFRSLVGSDGDRALACIRSLVFVPRHVAQRCLPQLSRVA